MLKWVDTFEGAFAITIPQSYAKSDLPIELVKRGIPSYVHTVNDSKEAEVYMNRHRVTEIYTDFLVPKE